MLSPFHRRSILQGAVRTNPIVVISPNVQEGLRFGHTAKDMAVQAFVAQPAVEAFDEGILYRTTRSNEIESHAVGIRPRVHRLAYELRSVVDPDRLRLRATLQHPAECGR